MSGSLLLGVLDLLTGCDTLTLDWILAHTLLTDVDHGFDVRTLIAHHPL